MRKLVSLRKISDIQPIPNADAIEVATVDGWQCVVKKGEFSLGQVVVYFEIDSILPKGREEFEFLMARSCKMQPTEDGDILEGHRLRTIKLRGQISQGLIIALPTDALLFQEVKTKEHTVMFRVEDKEAEEFTTCFETRSFDDDISDIYGVKKYERPTPAQLAGMSRGNYPGWLPKTDQERVQNLRYLPEGPFYIEEKMEGSSMTIYHDGEEVGVTSRNLNLKMDQEGNAFVNTAKASGLIEALNQYQGNCAEHGMPSTPVAIRGELIGSGIQGNIYKLPSVRFHIFDIWVGSRYLTPEERQGWIEENLADMADKTIVQCARPLGKLNPSELTVAEIVEMANGRSEYGDTRREGLVFKACCLNRHNQVESFKAISPDYLLKEAE